MSDAFLSIRPGTLTSDVFIETYGGIYEHSQWIADGAFETRKGGNLVTVNSLHQAMMIVLDAAKEAAKMTLICAHPDLAGKLAIGEALTTESTAEQKGAGLDRCTPDEFEEFQTLNTAYKAKFGFPFIIAVKGIGRRRILAAFRARINNDRETEFNMALTQINRIAFFRLAELAE
ncbi:MAG: 2-oxo-4-hydroxy-4-carboxy-5-ureidoimidazoline decarboxylase [Kordiimonadaceae bacterium]|nr:2-oxo-4-hydroxy-4-carboxy-5-ureidoimidazoline decarboxylase [Kordiimonadaceae bacterium]